MIDRRGSAGDWGGGDWLLHACVDSSVQRRAVQSGGGLSEGGGAAYPRLFGRRLIPIRSMGGGLTRRRGNSTTLLCLFVPCLVSMELTDRRSSGALLPGKLLFLFGSMTSFSILVRSSNRSSFAVSSSPVFTPLERSRGPSEDLDKGRSTC